MGTAFAVAVSRVQQRLDEGETPRADDFFDGGTRERSDAEELLEGVLLHAGNAHEERKTPYIGNIFASVAFREDISPSYGHYLVDLADRLTYHQLVCLAVFGNERFRAQLEADVDYEKPDDGALLPTDLRAEIDELARLYLLGRLSPDDQGFTREWGYPYLGNIYEGVGPTDLGRDLADVMELHQVPHGEQEAVLAAIRGAGS